MGAWIEINSMPWYASPPSSRTPRGCVDWNIWFIGLILLFSCVAPLVGAWIEIRYLCRCDCGKEIVAPLVGAWIEMARWRIIRQWLFVAPLVGAWIEITESGGGDYTSTGRTPRGCVDWNSCAFMFAKGLCSRTLRGCVDWNSRIIINSSKGKTSHPSWVRGLK